MALFLEGPITASYLLIFGFFQTNINTNFHLINGKNGHRVYTAEIRTHDLKNTSLLL